MKFNSIREYFYKLHNALYALVLVPLAAFIFLYLQMQSGGLEAYFHDELLLERLLLIVLGITIGTSLVVSTIIFNQRLKKLRKVESLGERLSGYYSSTVIRYAIVIGGLLVLAGGFFLTESQFFTGMFVASLGVLSLTWPTPAKVCKDLRLRGDERLMVLYRKEELY